MAVAVLQIVATIQHRLHVLIVVMDADPIVVIIRPHHHALHAGMDVEALAAITQHLLHVPLVEMDVVRLVATILLHHVLIVVHNVHHSVKDSRLRHVQIVLQVVTLAAGMIVTIHVLAFAVENVELPAVVNVKGNAVMAVVLNVLDTENSHTAHRVEILVAALAMKIAPMIATLLAKVMGINN